MNTARADAQKYGLGAIIVAVVVLLLFFGLNKSHSGARDYIGAPASAANAAAAAGSGTTSDTSSGTMSK